MTNPSSPSIAQTFKAGDKLAGCYTLKEMLPPQGCCVVWLAHDEELNKDIVLHFVPDSVAADTRAMSELKQEAKRNRQLIHPRIVRVHDLVEDERWAAISMDLVQGETLAELKEKRPGKVFNPSDLATGVAELCQTIEDAHRIELFHRDLCPENIIATGSGIVVQKFGLSRVILDSLARAGQTIPGSRDLAYISPQQLDGERPSRGDDIYSLGATVYDLLTGAPPFNQKDLVTQIRKTVPPPVSERRAAEKVSGEPVPKAWDEAVAACLAKTPEERPKSAGEAGTRFASGKPGAAPAPAAAPAAPAPAPAAAVEAAAGAAAGVAAAEAAKAATPAAPAKETTPAAPAKETTPAAPAPQGEKPKESPAPAEVAKTPEPETAKQQKRPWTPGPGKTPVITEATVISNTPVPKSPGKTEPAPAAAAGAAKSAETAADAKKGGPTTPTGFPLRAFVEVDQDQKKAKAKSSSPFFVAGGVVLLVVIVLAYIIAKTNNTPSSSTETAATSGTETANASAPAEAGSSPIPVQAASPASSAPVNVAENSTPAPSAASPEPAASAPAAVAMESPSATPEAAASPSATEAAPVVQPMPASELANLTDAQADQLLAAKTKALDEAKAALADAEKKAQAQAAAQTDAASAVQALQAQIKQRADAAAAAKTTADAAAAALAQQQDALNKARADADAAQKAAAAKVAVADQLAKTLQDAQAAAQSKQTAAQQAAADADQLTKTVADRQKAADDAAKAAADAEKARQQEVQAVEQTQAELTQIQTSIAQNRDAAKARAAAEEKARIDKERAEEAARLNAQAVAAAKAAADAQKALEVAQKAVADAQRAQAEAEREAEAAKNGTLPTASPAASPEASPAASATPPPSAAASPAASGSAPTLSVRAPSANLKVDQALINSLGMRFAPVGHIFFCLWPTRVQDFEAFVKATGYTSTAWQDPGFKQGPDHPVVNVSWNDANQFCLWLTQKEHHEGILSASQTYRLPTDLEWSSAVGLPTETGRTASARDMDIPNAYPWGTQWPPPPGAGNYTGEETDSDVAIKGYNDGFAWTSPVGSFNPNKLGLYDMGGNVWEWVEDWWDTEQKEKVLRGASWNNGALTLSLLSSCREKASPDSRLDDYGFRIVIASEGGSKKRHLQ